MYWCYLPTYCHQFRDTQENKFFHCSISNYFMLQVLIKDLLGQKLVPIVPPGLHSAQTRHDFALRELVQFEQLAPDHDPSVKIQNTLLLEYQQNNLEILQLLLLNTKSNILQISRFILTPRYQINRKPGTQVMFNICWSNG